MKIAVVGHVEWAEIARVERIPGPGAIVEASAAWEQPAGGGAVAAVQIARLAGECLFMTALADDTLGSRAKRELEEMGLRVEVAWRPDPQRRAFVHLEALGERAITLIGERMAPRAIDTLPWAELKDAGAVYFTAGDAGALRAARAAEKLVASVRAGEILSNAGVQLDVLLMSAGDEAEKYRRGDIEPVPLAVVRTDGAAGGSIETPDGRRTNWSAPPLPGPRVDAYGAGDSFAGGLTYGLGQGLSLDEAVTLGGRCGAASATGRGPYEGQLTEVV
jgi:ribokinase